MFQRNVKLSAYSNYRIGGAADHFFEARTPEEISSAIIHFRRYGKGGGLFILGGGTNLLIGDEGFRGLVLKPRVTGIKIEGDTVRVGAGSSVKELLEATAASGLSGLEWAGGLPGTVGGAIRGNAGAFGGETKDRLIEVWSLDISDKKHKVVKRGNDECNFGYRTSYFKENDGKEIILEALFRLEPGDPAVIRAAIDEKINYRLSRHPMEYPSIGSTFKNVDARFVAPELMEKIAHVVKKDPFPVVPAAHLISEAGLKGVSYGGAMISPKHPNFIVNVLRASSEDVKQIIKLAKVEVHKKFGIVLEEEIIYL
jgi:UDP-N-acetylmuramate dehydrogenase